MAQATKAKFLEAGPFHQALKARVERYFQESGTAFVFGLTLASVFQLAHCVEEGVRYRTQESVGAALGSHVRWLKRMGRPALLEAAVMEAVG